MAQVVTLNTGSAGVVVTVAQVRKFEQDSANPSKRKVTFADGSTLAVTQTLAEYEAAANA